MHTPGPYTIVPRGVELNGFAVHSSIEVESSEGPRVIALIMGCSEAVDNAELFQDAPETARQRDQLLEAAKALVANTCLATLDGLKAAIAATGPR